METERTRVLNALPGLAWTALPDGRVDFVSILWCEYTGEGPEEAQGCGWLSVVHRDDLPALLEHWQSALDSGARMAVEARLSRLDGVFRWFLVCSSPMRDASGQISSWYGVCTDIDDFRRTRGDPTQAALGQRTRALAIGELAGSIAREVNQPLSGIVTNADTCMRMLGAQPPNIDGAVETARRTKRLVIECRYAVLGSEEHTRALRECYASLSPRERQVMALVVAGRLNKQVGGELGISEITVKAHRGKVMAKMRASSFAELVRMSDRVVRTSVT